MMSRKKKNKSQINQIDSQSEMLDRFKSLLSVEDFDQLNQELKKPYYPSLRLNPFKIESPEIFETLRSRYQWEIRNIPFCSDGYWVTQSPQPISKTIEHSMGHYYIQDAASMLPVELFDFKGLEQPLILDMAASPGGKTTHLVSRSKDKGLVLANDSSRDRLTALRIVLQNWGASHTAISNFPGEYFGKWFPEIFDRVLLDAPCSMQGLRATDAHPLRPITQKEINALSRRQTRLLESAINALKPGGQAVYSTCTLTPEENEVVLDNIIHIFGNTIQIDPLDQILSSPAPGLSSYGDKFFNPQVTHAARLWPFSFGTAGFFAARITKLSSLLPEIKSPPARPLAQAGWFPLSIEEVNTVYAQIMEVYGFSLHSLIDENNLEIWSYKNSLYLFPLEFLRHFPDFPVQSLGLALGEFPSGQLTFAHEFVTRFGNLITRNILHLTNDHMTDWMHGGDIPLNPPAGNSEFVYIIKDQIDRIIGSGKFASGRLRNLLPRRILITGEIA